MASNEDQRLFQCTTCKKELDMESKTLTCLHSFCGSCLNRELQGKTSGNGQCPECLEHFQIDQLTLSPVLINSLCRWKCDMCLEDRTDSIATNWCHDCVKFFCENCSQFHKRLPREKHNSVELDKNGKEEVRKSMSTDLCKIHNKIEESYCKRCNVCLCDTCYTKHLNDSPQCPSRPISVSEEVLNKEKSEGPTLVKEISDLENHLRERNKECRMYNEQLERECDLKCEGIWQNYKEILEELKEKMHEMCEELRRLKNEQVKKWRQLVGENERMLKKLEIWRINLCHLLEKDQNKKTDIVCGVELVRMKLVSSSSSGPPPKKNEPMRKCELGVKFSTYYLEFLEGLKNQMIGSASLDYSENFIQFENEWVLPGSKPYRDINSIVVNVNDNHIFLADKKNKSIIELSESGELVSEVCLTLEGEKFCPLEMVFSSAVILVVHCVGKWRGVFGWKLIFLEREKFSFFKIKKIIETENKKAAFSVCHNRKTISICVNCKFEIDFYTENGEYLKTIDTGVSGGSADDRPHLIRADPSNGNFWGTKLNTCRIFCFNEKGKKLRSYKTEEKILDFSVSEFKEIYYCNFKGIFSFTPGKNLHKTLHGFQKSEGRRKPENYPKIFVSKEKMFVRFQIDGKNLIKIFKFL